jgi:hypothetical protein
MAAWQHGSQPQLAIYDSILKHPAVKERSARIAPWQQPREREFDLEIRPGVEPN